MIGYAIIKVSNTKDGSIADVIAVYESEVEAIIRAKNEVINTMANIIKGLDNSFKDITNVIVGYRTTTICNNEYSIAYNVENTDLIFNKSMLNN